MTLLAAEGHWQTRGRIALIVAGATAAIVLDGGPIPTAVPAWIMAATLAVQVVAIVFNAVIVLTPGRAPLARRVSPSPTTAPSDDFIAMSTVS